MRGLADQRGAVLRELPGLLDCKRKQMPSRFDADTAENGMRLPFGGLRQLVIAQRDQPFCFPGRGNPYHAAALAGQRHEYAWTLRRVKFGRNISMRPRMANVEGQRRLVERAA